MAVGLGAAVGVALGGAVAGGADTIGAPTLALAPATAPAPALAAWVPQALSVATHANAATARPLRRRTVPENI